MLKLSKASWPVLFVSDQLQRQNDVAVWLHGVIDNLTGQQDCRVMQSSTVSDAHDIIYSHEDLGTIIVDWDIAEFGREHPKNRHLKALLNDKSQAAVLIEFIRERNKNIPVLLLTDRCSIENTPDTILSMVDGVIWKLSDTYQFVAGRIERNVIEYSSRVLPAFFQELVTYVNEYKFAWHTPGHMGGEGFLRSPSGSAFHKFFGENVLRSDLSISVPELGSLLDHSGLTGEAEKFSAKIFGANQTYYVLNGTSTANQIIWRSQVSPNDVALVDRNCHKSLNYAMIITSAKPEYMIPMRNGFGIIGPVDFTRINKTTPYKMSALTNSTYDGVCYNTSYVERQLAKVAILHFDEAWYAYAKFHPIYQDHFGMSLQDNDKLVFCSQSTHKLLTAFSQASMIHVKFPQKTAPEYDSQTFHDLFNESYMMHGSTSPQYSMIASLEISSKMMADNGQTAWTDIIEEAIELRRKIAAIKAAQDWFFGMWQPDCIADTNISICELATEQRYWTIKPGDTWHGFKVADEYAMLDPIKLTFTCPGIDINGIMDEVGIPAAIVTNYLIDKGIVCEKTDYYSWLLLNSLGTTRGKQGTLVAELFKFKQLYDNNAPLEEVFPQLARTYPQRYNGQGLKDHCQEMHNYIKKYQLVSTMIEAFAAIPTRQMLPVEAYQNIVKQNVEYVLLRNMHSTGRPRTAAVMLVPYPPGIPIMMGGETFDLADRKILKYLLAREDFENTFPGYESDIHGIERTEPDNNGKVYFKTLVIKEA
jgi:lysine decarboxylase/arginine decarboxylase